MRSLNALQQAIPSSGRGGSHAYSKFLKQGAMTVRKIKQSIKPGALPAPAALPDGGGREGVALAKKCVGGMARWHWAGMEHYLRPTS